MNCQQVNNLIWDYCDGLLSPESRAEFETHLNECDACNELTRLTSLENEAIKTLPDMVVSDNFTSQLMLTIASPGSQAAVYPFSVPSSRRNFAFGPFSLIGAIAALLLMCFSFWPDLQHNQIAMDNITENRPGKQVIKPDAAASKSAKQTPDKSKLGVGGLADNFAGPEVNLNESISSDSTVLKAARQEEPKPQLSIPEGTKCAAPAAKPSEDGVMTASSSDENSPVYDSKKQFVLPDVGNLPDSYQLLESTWENGARILVYSIAGSKETMRISLALASESAISHSTSRALKSEQILEDGGAKAHVQTATGAAENTVIRNLSFNNTLYQLTIKSSVDVNELIKLASQIELQEEKPAADSSSANNDE